MGKTQTFWLEFAKATPLLNPGLKADVLWRILSCFWEANSRERIKQKRPEPGSQLGPSLRSKIKACSRTWEGPSPVPEHDRLGKGAAVLKAARKPRLAKGSCTDGSLGKPRTSQQLLPSSWDRGRKEKEGERDILFFCGDTYSHTTCPRVQKLSDGLSRGGSKRQYLCFLTWLQQP